MRLGLIALSVAGLLASSSASRPTSKAAVSTSGPNAVHSRVATSSVSGPSGKEGLRPSEAAARALWRAMCDGVPNRESENREFFDAALARDDLCAEDIEHYAAQCLLQGRRVQARVLLLRAIAGGCESARQSLANLDGAAPLL